MFPVSRLVFFISLFVFAIIPCWASAAQKVTTPVKTTERLDKLGDPLPKNAIARFGTKRLVHRGGGPSMIVLSKDEEIIFSTSDSWMMAWSTESGKLLWQKRMNVRSQIRVGAAGYGVRSMCIMPDSGELISSTGDGSLQFWNPETGDSKIIKSPMDARWKSIDVSLDSQLVAIGGTEKTCVCDPTGKLRYEIPNNPQEVIGRENGDDRLTFGGDFSYARFSPDGKVLALVNSEKQKTIQLFEAITGKPLREIKTTGNVVRMDFAPDSSQIVASERDNAARLYNVDTVKQIWEFQIAGPPNVESYTSDIAFRPDGKQIAVGAPIGPDNRIRLLNATDGKEQGSLSGSGWKPWPMQFTRDGKFLYGSGWSADIHKWNVETRKEEPLPGGAVRASSVCAMSGDGKHLAFVNKNGIHLVDIESDEIVKSFQLDDVKGYGQVIFNHDGSHLAVGYSSEAAINIVIWEVATEKEIHRWDWAKGRDLHSSVEALAFSQKGNRIAAAVFRQSAAYVFDLPSDQQVCKVKHRSVYGADIDKDGSTLLTTGWDKTIRAWKIKTSEEIKSSTVTDGPAGNAGRGPDTRAYGLKLSHDQKFIATCDMSNKVRLFDRELRPIGVIDDVGQFTFGTIAISHNDLWVGIGTGDGVQVFDIASGKQVFLADEHDSYICTVDFGARDRTMVSGGSDSVCYLWDITPSSGGGKLPTTPGDFRNLVGTDGVKAYSTFQELSEQPSEATEFLRTQLAELVVQKFDDKEVAKWIVGLGSDVPDQRSKAESKLLELGPAIYDQLSDRLEEKLTDNKRELITQVRNQIHRNYRRATVLLAELDSQEAEEAIDGLMKSSNTKMWKRMLFEAKKLRKK